MPLRREEVEHVARLAHLALAEDEVTVLTEQLSSIVDHVDRLRAIDTEGIEPTAQIIASEKVMRADEARPSWLPARLLANAPRRRDDFFEVDAILE